MFIKILKSKAESVALTAVNNEAKGVLYIDEGLFDEMKLYDNEVVEVISNRSGKRYTVTVQKGKIGACELNGLYSTQFSKKEEVTLNSYCYLSIEMDGYTEKKYPEKLSA